jgi:acyl-CoA thioester hydrolase
MAHLSTIDVRFSEIDPYGHVNHAVYLTYFEVARTEALVHCGLPIQGLAQHGFHMVVTELSVRFRGPAGPGDRLTVETTVSALRRARAIWSQRILRDTEVLVTAEITIGVTDRAGRPTRPPDWLFPTLQPLLDWTP